MEGIFRCVCDLRKSGLKEKVDSRLREFKEIGEKTNEDIFNEMCFCILTANYSAEGGMRIQKAIGNGFLKLPEKDLARKLSELGHRYPQLRAKFIAEARKHHGSLKETIRSFGSEENAREWIVKNVKGLGYKEASHFLRNIGFENLAIIDFHIIDILANYNVIERPKTLTRRKYLEIEKVLRKIAGKLGMNLAELDLYLWYAETGKVLK